MAYGLRPVKQNGSAYNTVGFTELPIADAYATNIFNGDPVQLSSGLIVVAAGVPKDNAQPVVGTLVGARWVDANGTPQWGQYYDGNADNTECFAFVATGTDQLFLVRSETAVANSQIGVQYDITAGAGGSTTTGNSSYDIDVSAGAAADGAVILVDWPKNGTNETSSTPDVIVKWASGTHSDF